MDAELLITEVKKRPVIWDASEECYKNKAMKNDAWVDVATKVDRNFRRMSEAEQKTVLHEIAMKWRSIRDNYVRYKKKMSETTSRSQAKPFRSYIYSKQLRFLNKSIQREPLTPNTNSITTPPAPTLNASCDFIDPMDVMATTQIFTVETIPEFSIIETEDNDTTTCSYSLPPKRPRTVITPTLTAPPPPPPLPLATLSLEDKLCKFMEDHKPREFDEDLSFFESLLPTIKILSSDEKLEFRIKTLQLLQGIKRKRENLPVEEPVFYEPVTIKAEEF